MTIVKEDVRLMKTQGRWINEIPSFSVDENAGLRLFWNTYQRHYDTVSKEVLHRVSQLPAWEAIARMAAGGAMTGTRQQSREFQERAITLGDWRPLIVHLRSQGAHYATECVAFRDWYDLVTIFRQIFVPYLVTEHAPNANRLTEAFLGADAYLDVALVSINEGYSAPRA